MDLEQADIPPVSFKRRLWSISEAPVDAGVALSREGASPLLAKILASRGMQADELPGYLKTRVRDTMPDPFVMKDMEIGAKRIARAIREKQRIGIWSDYDVDGAASAALFIEILRMCGHTDFELRIPDRITEGYGPNAKGLLEMKAEKGCDLICCLDAGIVAFEPLEAASEAGIEVIVIDHHGADRDGALPPGLAIINPNRLDDTSGLGHLCAAGVTFCFFVAVVRELSGYFDGKDGRPDDIPDLMSLLDLVALATICDVMKLHGLNRAFVRAGLPALNRRRNLGIAKLAAVAGLTDADPIDEETCGWVLGPRINAGGRIGQSESGARLLISEDPVEASERATALHEINVQRKEMSDSVTEEALSQLEDLEPGRDRKLAFAIVENAHEGVVGISAGKVKQAKDAPAIVVTLDHEGNLKGSARSVGDVDIGRIIQDAAKQGLILKGGGHAMAGGLNLRQDQVDGFVDFANSEIEKTRYFREGIETVADIGISLRELNVKSIESLDLMRPFGNGNTRPLIVLKSVVISGITVLKGKHFKVTFSARGQNIDGLIWDVAGTQLGRDIEAHINKPVDVLCTAQINEFLGKRNAQVMIEDMRPAENAGVDAPSDLPVPGIETTGLAAKAAEVVRLFDVDLGSVAFNEGSGVVSLVTHARVDEITSIKGKHLKVYFSDGNRKLTALRWNAAGGKTEARLRNYLGMDVNVLGELEINEFRGNKSLQIKLQDFEPHEERLL